LPGASPVEDAMMTLVIDGIYSKLNRYTGHLPVSTLKSQSKENLKEKKKLSKAVHVTAVNVTHYVTHNVARFCPQTITCAVTENTHINPTGNQA